MKRNTLTGPLIIRRQKLKIVDLQTFWYKNIKITQIFFHFRESQPIVYRYFYQNYTKIKLMVYQSLCVKLWEQWGHQRYCSPWKIGETAESEQDQAESAVFKQAKGTKTNFIHINQKLILFLYFLIFVQYLLNTK